MSNIHPVIPATVAGPLHMFIVLKRRGQKRSCENAEAVKEPLNASNLRPSAALKQDMPLGINKSARQRFHDSKKNNPTGRQTDRQSVKQTNGQRKTND